MLPASSFFILVLLWEGLPLLWFVSLLVEVLVPAGKTGEFVKAARLVLGDSSEVGS